MLGARLFVRPERGDAVTELLSVLDGKRFSQEEADGAEASAAG